MAINKIDLKSLRNDAHFQYQSDFRNSVIKGGGAGALVLLEGIANYETFINTLNAVIAKYAVRRHHHSSEPRLTGFKDFQELCRGNPRGCPIAPEFAFIALHTVSQPKPNEASQ